VKSRARRNLTKPLVVGSLIAFVLLLPVFVAGYWIHVITIAAIDVILVVSFRLITQMGGWSFAHVGLMSVGGYTSALLTTKYLHWSFWLTLPLGGLAAACVALAISYPCLRTREFYFFLSTFAAGEAIRQVWVNWRFFGAIFGIPFLARPTPILGLKFVSPMANYYLILFFCLLTVFILYWFDKSRISKTLLAINSHETLCSSMGINAWGYRALAFVVGSFFAGIAGVLFVHFIGYANPVMFTTLYSFKIVTAAIIGGVGTLAGPIIGLIILVIVTEIFRDMLLWFPIVQGLLIVLVLLFLPHGLESVPSQLSPLVGRLQGKIRDKLKKNGAQGEG